jgi:xanthine dehydrogenase YagS FAD-binding subunit
MQSFEWVNPASVEQAAELLGADDARGPVVAKAGGIDLLDLMKEGILKPARLVNLRAVPGLDRIVLHEKQGLELGALVTLARIAEHAEIRRRYGALSEAAGHAATPQVRNAATIGGNLLQRPRCWYFRSEYFHLPGAKGDPREGENQYHAIFDNQRTPMVHSSTPATALVAYGATVELVGRQGKSRTVAVKDLLLPPEVNRDRDTVVEPGEVLSKVMLPGLPPGTRAAYHKQTERDSYDWPICDVAVVLRLERGTVRSASIAMGWVAPTPRRASESEKLLTGRRVDVSLAREAAKAAVAGATPLSRNGYKVPILEAVVRRTILAAAGQGGS